jgi:hypothetical protein
MLDSLVTLRPKYGMRMIPERRKTVAPAPHTAPDRCPAGLHAHETPKNMQGHMAPGSLRCRFMRGGTI